MRFDENAQRISVNGRPKRIKMYALIQQGFARYEKSGKVNLTSGFSLHFSLQSNQVKRSRR